MDRLRVDNALIACGVGKLGKFTAGSKMGSMIFAIVNALIACVVGKLGKFS